MRDRKERKLLGRSVRDEETGYGRQEGNAKGGESSCRGDSTSSAESFAIMVASMYRDLPKFLEWDSLEASQFELDVELLAKNAASYKVSMKTPLEKDLPLPIDYPPYDRWAPLVNKHAWSVFQGVDDNCDIDRVGEYIYGPVLEVAMEWLVDHLVRTKEGTYPRVLVGSTDHFTTDGYADLWSDQELARTLRLILKYAIRDELTFTTAQEYVQFIRSRFDRLLLPYNVADNHYLLFEVVFRKGFENIKIWDSYDHWHGQMPLEVPQLVCLASAFFEEGEEIMIHIERSRSDPDQGSSHGCAAFTFFTSAHRALGMIPPAVTGEDDAYLRNYLWGCIVNGKLLPFPKPKARGL